MSRLNTSLAADYQARSLSERMYTSTNGADLSYQGFSRRGTASTPTLYRKAANVNRVLFWLSSKRHDYVRESSKGGVLYSLLGQLCSDTNLKDWERILQDRFNEEFADDMTMMFVRLTADRTYRRLTINMAVRDRLDDTVFPVTTEAKL